MSLKRSYLDDEKYTYEYFCQNNVCRLCWSANNTIKPKENNSTIAEKILQYIGTDVTTGTPNKVCSICLNKLKRFINFKKLCQEAERKLNIILSKTFKESFDNPVILKKEADIELTLLAKEVKKEKLDNLIIKQEKDSKFETDSISDYDDLLPKDDNFCYICNLNFNSVAQLTKHKLKCHKAKKKPVFKRRGCTEELTSYTHTEFKCNVCLKNFPTYESFESHVGEHEKSDQTDKPITHQCMTCLMTFETSADLKKHWHSRHRVRKKNTKKQKCVCEICGQAFSKNNMQVHMLIHTNYKQLKCPYCDYRATLQASLNTHIKLHTGERPFACDQCPYRCITSSNLNKHKKTHTGVKEFTCHICHKEYRYNSSLRDHITSAHQGERKNKCKQCGAQYFHFKGLRKHMLVKHGQKVKKVKDDFVEVDRETYMRMSKKEKESGMGHVGLSQDEAGMSHLVEAGMCTGESGMSHGEAGMSTEESRMSHEEAGIPSEKE